MFKDLIKKNRSYRRFEENKNVRKKTLEELIDFARCSASAVNRQPLKYIISNTQEKNSLIFPNLSWAGYIKDWDGPQKGERPSSYIIMLGDTEIADNYWCDPGIAAQSILLGATERGLGGCILGAVAKDKLRNLLEINDIFEILYVIALGKPAEDVVLENVGEDGSIKYWRDENDVHHVPKRPLSEIIVK